MGDFFTWMRANILALIVAFFLERVVARLTFSVLGMVGFSIDSLFLAITISLVVQGLWFSVLFHAVKRQQFSGVLTIAAAAANFLVSLPIVALVMWGELDPRLMLIAIPASFLALALAAWRFGAHPITANAAARH